MTLLDVLDITDTDQIKFLDKIVKTFSGLDREWSIKTKEGYSKHFRINSTEELLGRAKQLANGQPYELHMSVQQFSKEKLETISWTFLVDIDAPSKEDKEIFLSKVLSILDKFGIFYLVDNHNHVFIPEWEHALVENWGSLYGDDFFVESLANYLEKLARLPYGTVDRMLWKANRHTVRMPYSQHLEGGRQEFLPNCEWTGTEEEFTDFIISLWDGSYFDKKEWNYFLPKGDTYFYARNFKTFIDKATELGRELLLLEEEQKATSYDFTPSSSNWIEKLLKTKVPKGYRSRFLWLVISPYLVTIKKLSKNEATNAVSEWLIISKADKFLDRNLYSYLRNTYSHFQRKEIKPCSLERLREHFPDMYKVLVETGVVNVS